LVAAAAAAPIAAPTAPVSSPIAAAITPPATATAAPVITAAIPAIATAPTTAETAATAASEATPTTGRTFLAWAGDVHGQGPATELLAVEHFDGLMGFFGTAEFDKGEAAGTARELVEHQVDVDHHASGAEVVLEVAFEGLKRQVSYE
jgi:hypothetical protein